MKVITLMNEKGGVGKTTTATTIAAGLAIKGHRVLLIDADPQGNATQSFGIEPYPGVYDTFFRNAPFTDTVRLVPADRVTLPDNISQYRGQLFILGGNVETRSIATDQEDMEVFLNRLIELDDSGIVDFVIVDTSPTPTMLHTKLYLATDAVLYPTRLEAWSFGGLARSLQYRAQANRIRSAWQLPAIDVLGILPVMTKLSTTEHAENLRVLKEKYGELVWRPVPDRILWAESASARRSIFAYSADEHQAVKDAYRILDGVMSYATS